MRLEGLASELELGLDGGECDRLRERLRDSERASRRRDTLCCPLLRPRPTAPPEPEPEPEPEAAEDEEEEEEDEAEVEEPFRWREER
jgi:hypothetical protein